MQPEVTTRDVVHRSCTLCEAGCGLAVEVERGPAGDRVLEIRGDALDPHSRGYLCPKGVALQDLQDDPDRLRHPLRRLPDGSHERIGWDEALDLAADMLAGTVRRHGPAAVGLYLGNPIAHGWAPVLLVPQLLSALGTRNRFHAASLDQQPQHLTSYLLYGSPLLLPVPDLDRTDLWLVLGGNPAVSNGSIMTAPDVRRRIKDLRRRGGRLVVVDPRRTETAELADEHVFVRPATDVFLLASLAHTLLAEGLARPGRLTGFVDGLAEVERFVADYPPERTEPVTGVPAATTRALARALAAAPRAAVYGRLGVCQTELGTPAYWLIHCLNVLTGNLDRVGGVLLPAPAFDLPALGRLTDLVGYDRWRSRVRGLPEVAAEFPTVTLADEILTAGPGRLRSLLLLAGNPVLSAPDGRRTDEALAALDHCVAVDFYLTESTRHADVVLPPQAPLERDEFDVVFGSTSVRNQARWSPRAVRPGPDTRSDADILWALVARVHDRLGRPAAARAVRAAERAGLERLVDGALRAGPYGVRRGRQALTLARVQRAEHGLDLGALEPSMPDRLFTDDRRVHLAPPQILADLPRVAAVFDRWLAAGRAAAGTGAEDGLDLLLVGRRHVRSNNSWMHNSPRLAKGRDRCTLLIHPDDAARRGVSNGQSVVLRSAVGQVVVPAEVTDAIMPGVVSVPHGFGHGSRPGVGWRRAAGLAGPSVNDVVDTRRHDALSGNAALTAVPVSVAPVPASTPEGDEVSPAVRPAPARAPARR